MSEEAPVRGQVMGFGQMEPDEVYRDVALRKPALPRRHWFVSIHWFDGKPPLRQPMTEMELLILMTKIVLKHKVVLDCSVVDERDQLPVKEIRDA